MSSMSASATASASGSAPRPKQELYAAHIRTELLPALGSLQGQIGKLEFDIAEYQTLNEKIAALQSESASSGNASGKGRREALTELGGGVWVDTELYDTSHLTLDLGLDLHLEMPLEEAVEYVKKRVEILRKRRAGLKVKEEHLHWQIQQFTGAIAEATRPTAQLPQVTNTAE